MESFNAAGSSKVVSAFPTAKSVTNRTTAQTDQMNPFIVESTNAQEFRYKTSSFKLNNALVLDNITNQKDLKANYNKTFNLLFGAVHKLCNPTRGGGRVTTFFF